MNAVVMAAAEGAVYAEDIFTKINNLSTQAMGTIKIVVAVIAAGFVVWRLVTSKMAMGALVSAGIAAALAVWLVVSGVGNLSETADDTLSLGRVPAHTVVASVGVGEPL